MEYECCEEKYRKIWIFLEMNAEVCTAHASIAEFASRCSVVLRDLDIMSTSTWKNSVHRETTSENASVSIAMLRSTVGMCLCVIP